MLSLNDKIAILLLHTKENNSFALWIEKTYKHPYYNLSNYNLNEAIEAYCKKHNWYLTNRKERKRE